MSKHSLRKRNRRCLKKLKKRSKKTHVAGANAASSFKNIFTD